MTTNGLSQGQGPEVQEALAYLAGVIASCDLTAGQEQRRPVQDTDSASGPAQGKDQQQGGASVH